MKQRTVPHLRSFKDWLCHIFYGLCIGAADIIPGFSGGTMALILGIYEDFIYAIKSFSSKEAFAIFKLQLSIFFRGVSWDFLLAVLFGIGCSLIILSQAVQYVLQNEIYRIYLYSLFLGMISGSVIFCVKLVQGWRGRHWVSLIGGGLIAFLLTGSQIETNNKSMKYDVFVSKDKIGLEQKSSKNIKNYDFSNERLLAVSEATLSNMLARSEVKLDTLVFNRQSGEKCNVEELVRRGYAGWIDLWLIFCGTIAVSAMLLPGISGCYLLTILGAYSVVMGALADLVKSWQAFLFDTAAFATLANLGIGILLGAILFSRLISWLLEYYRTETLTMLIGFMIGAARTIWPFWTYEYLIDPLRLAKGPQIHPVNAYIPSLSDSIFWKAIGVVILGLILILLMEWVLALQKEKKNGFKKHNKRCDNLFVNNIKFESSK
jgi:putative membrane protein